MTLQETTQDEIARVAHAIWEAEGRPEGRDHEHWTRAKQLILEGRAEAEYPAAAAVGRDEDERLAPARPTGVHGRRSGHRAQDEE